eukprot:scaffold1616_cov310-Pinguiococcus_pyrenoidosus.AAC.23
MKCAAVDSHHLLLAYDSSPIRLYARKKKSEGEEKPLTSVQRKRLMETVTDFDKFEAALRLFVDTNGHARVSARYMMPDKEETPEELRGYNLGTRLRNLIKGKNVLAEEHPNVLSVLGDLGVDLDDEMSEWDRIIWALRTYKELMGDTKMAARFVIPAEDKWPKQLWGFRIGPKLQGIRTYGWHVRDDEQRMKQIDELGFEWRRLETDESRAEPFEVIVEALQQYKRVLGDLAVPSNFVVPSVEPWPRHLAGLPLGQRVAAIRSTDLYVEGNRDRVKLLSELGFIWSTREQNVDKRFKLALEAISKYKELYGDAEVPQFFKVPRDPSWPEHLWDMQLGNRVNSIRSHGTFVRNRPDRKLLLDEIGFSWDPPRKSRAKGRLVSDEARGEAPPAEKAPRPAGPAAKGSMDQQLPDMDVMEQITREDSFDEPQEDLEVWEMADTLQDGKPAEGYTWAYDEFGGGWAWDEIVGALRAYVEITGDAEVTKLPEDFVVGGLDAMNDQNPGAPFPDVCIPRRRMAERHARELKSWLEEREEDEIDPDDELVMEQFRGLQRERNPEADALAAQEELEKSEPLRAYYSMPLGVIAKRIRYGEILVRDSPQRLKDFKSAGIDFHFDEDGYLGMPYNLLLSALLVFRKVRGSCTVPWDFVIPESQPWPFPVRGVKLGLLTNQMRLRKAQIRKYHPDKWNTLFSLEFMWLPGRVLPGHESVTDISEYFVERTPEGDEAVAVNSVLAMSDERHAAQREEQMRQLESMSSISSLSSTPLR